MSDNHQAPPTQTVSLLANDWAIVRAGLFELPMKVSLQVLTKLEQQLAAQAQKPRTATVSEEAPHE